jgi:hypothetical protein
MFIFIPLSSFGSEFLLRKVISSLLNKFLIFLQELVIDEETHTSFWEGSHDNTLSQEARGSIPD